jgi:hypothetical protein
LSTRCEVQGEIIPVGLAVTAESVTASAAMPTAIIVRRRARDVPVRIDGP